MNKYIKNGVTFYTSSLLEKYKVPHAFTASRGGVSKGDFASLNISTSHSERNEVKSKNLKKDVLTSPDGYAQHDDVPVQFRITAVCGHTALRNIRKLFVGTQ